MLGPSFSPPLSTLSSLSFINLHLRSTFAFIPHHPFKPQNPIFNPFPQTHFLQFSCEFLNHPLSTFPMAANPVDAITNFTQTQRIVLLIDLNPLLRFPNPTAYINSLLTSAKTLLFFPPLSSSLFSFQLFFSSLSPLLSSSKVHTFAPNSSLSLSFNHPTSTFQSLSQTLNSLPQFPSSLDPALPRALHVAASIQQLTHDYAWEPVTFDPVQDTILNYSSVVRSNLVVLFSPLCKSFRNLAEFFNVEIDDDSLGNLAFFCEKFSGFFKSVSDAFDCRDIHFSWVDVSRESDCGEHKIEVVDEARKIYRLFERGVKTLGWGLCSVDSIIVGSALVSFGLIYPKIGISWSPIDINYYSRKLQVQLCLQILDVNRKPLEYNCCDLELIDLKLLSKCDDVRFNQEFTNSRTGGCGGNKKIWDQTDHGITKFQIKVVQRSDAFLKLRDCVSDSVLVREVWKESKKKLKEDSNECYADRVLKILATEFGDLWQRKSVPIWQILLSYLYKEGCWALVSLSNDNGNSYMCILRPFTVSSALLSVLDDLTVHDFCGANMNHYIGKMEAEPETHNKFLDSQAKTARVIDGNQKKKITDSNTLQNFTWSSFCGAAYDHFEVDLHDVYFAMECNKSKKLKFLKCWMRQMKKYGCCDPNLPEKSKPNHIISEEINNRLTESQNDAEQLKHSSASTGENTATEASRIQDDAALDFRSETSEVYFSSLSNKICQGIESEFVDLGALAERLVNSSIYWLSQKIVREAISDTQAPLKCNDASSGMVAAELIKLLLREPKELAAKNKSRNQFSQASDPGPTPFTTEHIVREYELQILFRMEILQSEIGGGIEESIKQKFVKQICLLLENIQCHMEGGFFGDWNLESYVAKIIKSRYSHNLENVVHKVYNKMDLLVFADADESPDLLLNSEDSNKSWKEKAYRDEMGENDVSNEPISSENEAHQHLENGRRLERIKQEDHDKKLMEAKKRRERARRFASFTSWMPDLQRVWAPKQKAMKPKSDPFPKLSKRKERRKACYETVCETPMTGNKRSCSRVSNSDDEDYRSSTSGSVPKALFQDDD